MTAGVCRAQQQKGEHCPERQIREGPPSSLEQCATPSIDTRKLPKAGEGQPERISRDSPCCLPGIISVPTSQGVKINSQMSDRILRTVLPQ